MSGCSLAHKGASFLLCRTWALHSLVRGEPGEIHIGVNLLLQGEVTCSRTLGCEAALDAFDTALLLAIDARL